MLGSTAEGAVLGGGRRCLVRWLRAPCWAAGDDAWFLDSWGRRGMRMHRMQCARDGRGHRLQIPFGGHPRRNRVGNRVWGAEARVAGSRPMAATAVPWYTPCASSTVPVPEPSRLYISSSRSSSPPNTAPDHTSHHRDRPHRSTRRPYRRHPRSLVRRRARRAPTRKIARFDQRRRPRRGARVARVSATLHARMQRSAQAPPRAPPRAPAAALAARMWTHLMREAIRGHQRQSEAIKGVAARMWTHLRRLARRPDCCCRCCCRCCRCCCRCCRCCCCCRRCRRGCCRCCSLLPSPPS